MAMLVMTIRAEWDTPLRVLHRTGCCTAYRMLHGGGAAEHPAPRARSEKMGAV